MPDGQESNKEIFHYFPENLWRCILRQLCAQRYALIARLSTCRIGKLRRSRSGNSTHGGGRADATKSASIGGDRKKSHSSRGITGKQKPEYKAERSGSALV